MHPEQVAASPPRDGSPEHPTPSTDPHSTGARVRVVAHTSSGDRTFEGKEGIRGLMEDESARAWVDVSAASDDDVAAIMQELHLHRLIVEDIAERNQRAKVTEVDDALHVVLFWISYDGDNPAENVHAVEIDIVLAARMLLIVHGPEWDPNSLPQLRNGPQPLLAKGPDFLLYAIADGIVDAYFPVLDHLEDDVDALQDAVIYKPSRETLERLFVLKRDLVGLRRVISPAREVFNQLTNRDLGLIAPDHIVYFRDVYDHLIRVTDELDTDRELVAGTLEVYLSTVNNNLSTIMKRLTGVTVILAGIGAVAGVFGMSEAGTALSNGEAAGFWAITLFIVLGAMMTAVVLRRIDWI